jgi:hypothetical protein
MSLPILLLLTPRVLYLPTLSSLSNIPDGSLCLTLMSFTLSFQVHFLSPSCSLCLTLLFFYPLPHIFYLSPLMSLTSHLPWLLPLPLMSCMSHTSYPYVYHKCLLPLTAHAFYVSLVMYALSPNAFSSHPSYPLLPNPHVVYLSPLMSLPLTSHVLYLSPLTSFALSPNVFTSLPHVHYLSPLMSFTSHSSCLLSLNPHILYLSSLIVFMSHSSCPCMSHPSYPLPFPLKSFPSNPHSLHVSPFLPFILSPDPFNLSPLVFFYL